MSKRQTTTTLFIILTYTKTKSMWQVQLLCWPGPSLSARSLSLSPYKVYVSNQHSKFKRQPGLRERNNTRRTHQHNHSIIYTHVYLIQFSSTEKSISVRTPTSFRQVVSVAVSSSAALSINGGTFAVRIDSGGVARVCSGVRFVF